jgi:hypothetical protein
LLFMPAPRVVLFMQLCLAILLVLDAALYAIFGDKLVNALGSVIYWNKRFRKAAYSLLFSPEDFRQVNITSTDDPELQYPYNSALWKNLGRRCYVTRTGLVGCGPKTMRKGDLVVVALGAAVPYILRPVLPSATNGFRRDLFQYVGEAYCHGIMNGELMADQFLSKRKKLSVC